jgi:hypothetical protein
LCELQKLGSQFRFEVAVENGVSFFRSIGVQALMRSSVKDSNGQIFAHHPIVSEVGHCNTPYCHKRYFSLQRHLDATVRLICDNKMDSFRRLEEDHLCSTQIVMET